MSLDIRAGTDQSVTFEQSVSDSISSWHMQATAGKNGGQLAVPERTKTVLLLRFRHSTFALQIDDRQGLSRPEGLNSRQPIRIPVPT